MDTVRVTIPTHYGLLFGVACVGEAEAWVYGNNQNIARFDIHGTANENVSAECNPWPGSISVTVHGNLIYSDTNTGTVKIFRHRNAEIFLTPPDGWTPLGLCCPTSGDILVQVYKNIDTQLRNKIIRYRGKTSYKNTKLTKKAIVFVMTVCLHCICQRTGTGMSVFLTIMLTGWSPWLGLVEYDFGITEHQR